MQGNWKLKGKTIDGKHITTKETELVSFNILRVEAGSTGYCGGDTGHGGRTYIALEDLSSTDIRIRQIPNTRGNGGIEIILGGDSELGMIIDALDFIKTALQSAIAEKRSADRAHDREELKEEIIREVSARLIKH